MDILVACEESQVVTSAFRAKGHQAYSCDVLSCSGDHPEWHIHDDVRNVLGNFWDMVIAFPPCTDLCCSGARWFAEKQKNGQQKASIDFFMLFARLNVAKVAIENPIGIMSRLYRRPDQIIQPWMFGHPESKQTCLWLKNLPLLMPTNNVRTEMLKLPLRERTRIHYMSPGENRSRLRSKTYLGVALAMADQWG